jgi:hypothetical protein
VDIVQPGRRIGPDISKGEFVEAEIDAFISKRHDRRLVEESHRPSEELWAASERAYFARRREENRLAWQGYFCHLAGTLRARAEEYERRAELLTNAEEKTS